MANVKLTDNQADILCLLEGQHKEEMKNNYEATGLPLNLLGDGFVNGVQGLKGLQRRGLIAERRPRWFIITDAGLEVLKKWYAEEPEMTVYS